MKPKLWVKILLAVIFIGLPLLVVKLLWAWTVPDLFPGAVQQGLVARSISWFTAFKLSIFVSFVAAVTGISSAKKGAGT